MKSLYVLKRQAVHEQRWLLDVLTETQGRLLLITGKSSQQADLFQPCYSDWQPDSEWPKLTLLECGEPHALSGSSLYCALYLNELLVRLLPAREPCSTLFRLYQQTLTGLSKGNMLEPWLRLFEYHLLNELGYGFDWHHDTRHQHIRSENSYQFVAQQGFVPVSSQTLAGISGKHIQALARWLDDVSYAPDDVSVWSSAKQILRRALEHQLEYPLHSRELFV